MRIVTLIYLTAFPFFTDRLEQSKKVISDLEARARDLERQNATLPELLDQMRRKTEADLQNYKKDVEAANNKNVSDELKNKIISSIVVNRLSERTQIWPFVLV